MRLLGGIVSLYVAYLVADRGANVKMKITEVNVM